MFGAFSVTMLHKVCRSEKCAHGRLVLYNIIYYGKGDKIMTRLETIRRFNLISSMIDTISAGASTWLGIKFIVWGNTVSKGIGKISQSDISNKDEAVNIAFSILKAGGIVATGLLSFVLVVIGIVVLMIAVNLIVPAVFGFISVRRASRCEEPSKSVKIVRTADIVRLVFHSFLMVGAVILVIIAIYNSAFGMAIIMAVFVSTIPFVLSILSLVWQGRMKGAAVNDDQANMD